MIRFNQLDGMRGIFSLILIFFHFPYQNSILTNNFFIRSGDLFVDFFFVLSGFVITHSYQEKLNTWVDVKFFLTRRVRRLYPLLLFSVISFALLEIVGMLFFNGVKHNNMSISEISLLSIDTLLFSNSIFFITNNEGMNYPTWSISAEMISYIVFAFPFFLNVKIRKYIFAFILSVSILFVFYKKRFMFTSDFGFIRGIIGFLFGYFTCQMWGMFKVKVKSKYEIVCFIFIILLFYIDSNIGSQLSKLLFPIFFSFTIYIFANSRGLISIFLNNTFFQFLGRISYSIYLNHAIILIIVDVLFFRLFKFSTTKYIVTFSLIVSLITTILYSAITYQLIEKRFSIFTKKMQ